MDKQACLEAYLLDNRDTFYRIAYYHVHHEADAYDVVQEATLKAFAKIQSLRNLSAMQAWFYRILLNCAYDCLKQRNRSVNMEEEWVAQIEDAPSDVSAVQKMSLMQAISKLEPKLKTAVLLKYFEDLSYPEIAKILHAPESTIKSRVAKALDVLKDEVKDDEAALI